MDHPNRNIRTPQPVTSWFLGSLATFILTQKKEMEEQKKGNYYLNTKEINEENYGF